MSWIYTYSGRRVDLFYPQAEQIHLLDIAQALSQISRWGGQAVFPYSVAQHSIAVSHLCDPEDAMAGLFHDAAEAYLGDICRPLKRSEGMATYREVYLHLERVIMHKYTGDYTIPPSVKKADEMALKREAQVLMPRHALSDDEWLIDRFDGEVYEYMIEPEHWTTSKQGFLLRYYRLTARNPGVEV